jgi:predicted phage terminase large subunit-like protein
MPAYDASWHHRVLSSYLDRFVFGDITRLMVFMPPQHGKSEAVSRRLPAYILGRKPASRIITASYTADLASAMNRDVQKIVDGPRYRQLFPSSRIGGKNVRTVAGPQPLRNREEFEVIDPLGQLTGGSYKSAGVGGGITGRPMDFGIIDDLIKGREEAESPACRESAWGWYNGDFLSRSHNDTRILITCTRWNQDDVPGRLLKRQLEDPKADQWTVVKFPAIREVLEVLDSPEDPRQLGEALWPARHSLESLERKRAASPYDWYSIYQQDPVAPGSTEWPPEFFGPGIWFDDWPDFAWRARVMSLDPSKGRKAKSGDYSAFVQLAVDPAGNLWVDADLDNGRPVEPLKSHACGRSIVGDGLDLIRAWKPQAFVVEINGFQELVATAFQRVAGERGMVVPIWTINSTEPKPSRIRTLGTYLAQKRLRVRNTRGGRLLVAQMKEFPNGTYDDGPDALKMAEVMADRLINGQREGASWPRPLAA